MLRNLCAIRRRGARFPARTSSSQLGALLRFGHRQLPRHLAQELSGHDVNGVYIKNWVEKKVRRHMLRARKRKGFGWKRWSSQWLYEDLKLFNSYRVRRPPMKVAPAR